MNHPNLNNLLISIKQVHPNLFNVGKSQICFYLVSDYINFKKLWSHGLFTFLIKSSIPELSIEHAAKKNTF